MAVKDSEELKNDERYLLGEYSFRIERSSGTSPGYDKFEAICTKGGKNARKSIQLPSTTKMDGWYVEANDTTADVYILVASAGSIEYNSGPGSVIGHLSNDSYDRTYTRIGSGGSYALLVTTPNGYTNPLVISDTAEGVWYHCEDTKDARYTTDLKSATPIKYDGVQLYYQSGWGITTGGGASYPSISEALNDIIPRIIEQGEPESVLVGRFAIDLEDAGGDGPGSDWVDPGDYDPDWEEGDPTHTLYVTVTGALSGRHNDPIVDPSYSYIPADKATVKDYGCGGDGGHGGGGGAGASTVVVHKFATNQANSKEVTAIARRHGYGSGGGKGGKGGDGCILVYY